MNAGLTFARRLKNYTPESEAMREVAFVQRTARGVLVALNLALIHKVVAEAIFFGKQSYGKETTQVCHGFESTFGSHVSRRFRWTRNRP